MTMNCLKRLAHRGLAALLGLAAAGWVHAADDASVVRGGRLYDHWSREAKEAPPNERHPAFPRHRTTVAAADTWRCSECHGWDYNGRHGLVGIRNRKGSDPAAIVTLLKDATHRYGGLMSESDLLDLANFVSRGQIDSVKLLEAAQRAKTPALTHEKFYGTLCAACHGMDGEQLREVPPLGDGARQRPQEVLHVIFNGHPGGAMPALSALGAEFAARMQAYLQTLPTLNMSAAIAHGGRLYDDWQVESRAQRQALRHPAYPVAAYFANDAATTWRCKECHGWDYKGKDGAYAQGRHATGIKGIRGMAKAAPEAVLAVLRNASHRYDAVLKERDLIDLAHFVSAGQLDMATAIDSAGKARGDGQRATATYRTICANCHGVDGQRIITAVPLGRVARTSPWESLHKIMNGHPNEKMPALRELDQQLLIDILAHLQGLPETR